MPTPYQELERYHQVEMPRFSEIIDVRTPTEFQDDHIPGAINCPVLSDEQRVEVGTIYKQVNPFEAKKRGAAHVSRNIAEQIERHFLKQPKDYRPLLYCWRGGQRSASLAIVLGQIGFRVALLNGGYKTYRGEVMDGLRSVPEGLSFRILAGRTGSGKTPTLRQLAAHGEQVLDLEAIACHRGSLLGSEPDAAQPAQRWFESQLYDQLRQFQTDRIIWVEAESNKIGQLHLPKELWHKLKASPGVELHADVPTRVQHLLAEYAHYTRDPAPLKLLLRRLKYRLGTTIVEAWCDDIDHGRWEAFVGNMLRQHYDPTYDHSFRENYPRVTQAMSVNEVSSVAVVQELIRLGSTLAPVGQSLPELVHPPVSSG
jgi:tRNA 2-selenouridine synthase